ncbi:uncharacterized protein LOC134283669 [Saccostrea cucullata]|uniref:uncharacterized protein LOC134283669 n=1 Tax=Saccostrea cuccullata TaxID=36930 RepID=UPI002ED275BD
MLRIDRNEKKRKHFSLMHENNEFRYHKEINGTIFWACKVAGCPGMLEEQNYKVRTIREHVHKSHVNDRRAKKWQTNPWYHTQSEDKYNHDPIEAYNINNSMKMSRDPVQPVDKPLPPTPRENEENMTPRYFYFDMPAKSHTKSAIPSVTTGQLPGGPKRERLDFGNDLSESSDSLRSVIECNDYRQRRFWVIMGIITLIALITVAVTLSLYFIDKSRLNEQLPKRGDDVVPQTTTDVQSTIARADEALSQITTTAINGAQQVPTQGASTSVSTLQAVVRDTKVSTDPNVAAPAVESSLSSSTTTQKTSSASSTTKTISTTTVQTSSLSTAPMVFSGSLILNRTWTAALSDDTTPQYKILSRAIEYELDTAFLTSPLKSLFNESQVTEFSSGSVRVFFKIVFRVTVMLDGQVDTSSVNVTDVRQTIEDEARRQQTTRTNGYLSTVMAGSISVKLANAPVVLMGDLFLNEAWNDSLNDPTSPISRKLTAQLKAELQATLLKLTENDFLDVEILGFRPGSIEVVFRIVMTINSTQNQSQIDVSTIIQAIQNEANRQLQQAVSGLLQKLITLTVDNQTLANATSSSVTSITPTVAATNLATTTDFATASTSSTQSTGTKEVATTFEPTTTIEASATMTTQQTTSFNAETTTVPVKSTSKPTISTESIKTTFQLEISSFKLETSTDLITATTVPVSSSSKPSVLTESITTFQPATTSLKLETSSVVITTTTVSVTSSFKPNISTKLITTTTQLASTVTTQSSASTLEATASSKSATTVIEPTEATIQPGTTSFQPKTSFSEAIISSTQPASITSTPTIIYSKSIATTLQQATTSLKPTTFSEVNTISSQSATTSFKQESMTEATKTTIQPATTTMEAIKSSKPAATLIESIIMITQPAESTSYPTTLNVTITTTTHLSITPTIQPATTREAIISFKSATTSTESEPSTFSEPKTSFEVIEITSHLATTSTGRLFTTQQALTTSKASAFTQLMSIFDATTGIYPKSTTEGIQTIQSSITTAYTYISFTLERTINETAIISLPVTTTSQSVFKANETVSITQPETITAKSPISSQIETTIIQPTASFITPSSTQLDVITVGTSAILQSIISTIEANFTQPRPTEKITPTLLVATTSLPTQYTPTPLPTSKQYTTSSLPTSTQYTTSPLPTSTQYTATPLPTSTQYSTTPLPTSTQYTTSMTTAATPDVCQDKTSIVANGWVCVLPYYSTITTEVDVDMFCKVIRDVLNCTVNNVEKELNISCPSNSLKTVASVYSPLLRDSIKMKHDPVECNLEPLNEICFSQEIFETSEFQQCFKTFNLLSDLPNSMEKEERCRIYTHSLRCVGENIADCDAGNIHKLINSSSLEITGRNSSVYDLKCSDLEPSQSFCDDKEALLLHIYGKCYINLLILSRTSCITVDSLMDCAYNQTGELYFNCSKTSIRSSLNNASSFYERKFPGYGQQIATCIQITDTNCSIAVQDIYSHPEAQKCLGIYLLLLLTNGSAALSDKTQCYTYQSVVHCVKDRLASCTVQDFDSLLRPLVAGVYKQKISPLCQVNDVLAPACTIESVIIDNADIYCKSPLAVLQASCSLTSVSMYVGCISSTMSMFNNTCTEDEVRSAMINATNYFEKLFPGEGLNISKCIETQEKGNCTVDKEFFSTPGYIRCIAPFHYGMTSGRGGNLTETKCRTYQRSLECTSKLNPACSLKDYDAMISLYYKSLETPLLDPSDCPMNRSLPNFCTSTNEIMYIVSVFCRDHFEWIRDFCPHSIDNFMECVANWTSRTAYECDENIIMEVISNDQMFYNSILPGSGSAITACISLKRLAFTIKMMSGFFWDDSLLNPDSSYFQDLSKIIAGNFEKTFGAVPGFLNISVSSFRKDTKYLDMALRYDSSMLSGVDFMDAIQLAVQNRTIDQLQVENYFLYRGELKDGECPTLQSKGDCLEECQMDSNCTGSEKCCYNGCGYTCQKPVSGIHPCEDYELLGQSGEQCSGALAQNLTSASNREQFCLVSEKFLNCVYEGILKETNVQCSKDQLITALKTFGPVMKSVMNLQSNPAECYEDLTSQMSTTLEFTTPQTLTDSSTTPQSVLLRYCRDSNTIISKGWRCVVPAVMNITTAKNFAEFCSFVDMVYICIMDGVAAEYNLTCRQSDKEFAIHLFSPMFKTAFNLEYNPGSCFAHETTISTFSWISTQFTTSLPSIATTIATMTTPTTPSPLLAKCSDTDVILSKTLQCVLPNFANITAAMDEVEFCRIVDLIFVCIMTEIGSEFSVLCRENDKEVAIEFYGPTLQSELSLNSNPVNCYLKTSSTVTTPLTSLSSAEPIMTTTESVQSTTEEFSSTTTTSQKFESTEMTTQPSKMTPTTVTQSPFSGKCRDKQEVLSKGWQCALPLFVNVTTAGNLLMFCSSFEMIFDCIMDGIELDYGVNCTEEDRNNITFFYAPNLQSAMALKYDPKECFLLKQTTVSPGSSMRPITTESPLLAVCEDSDTILAVGWICALPLYMNISRETDMSVFCRQDFKFKSFTKKEP